MNALIATLALVAFLVFMATILRGLKRRRPGMAAVGTVYDMLNEDKRKAVEIIVENRATVADPEHRDGNLPELSRGNPGKTE